MPTPRRVHWYHDRLSDSSYHMHAVVGTVYAGKSPFQDILILDTVDHGRILILDGDTQSAERDEFIYHEALVHPALVAHPNPQSVLILGGGEGSTLREVLRHPTVQRAVMVDIDEEVVRVSEKLLPQFSAGAFSDVRTELVFTDARKWLEEHDDTFDVILSDLVEPVDGSPSVALFTVEFYRLIQSRLNRPGLFAQQTSKGDLGHTDIHTKVIRTLRQGFKYVHSVVVRVPSFDVAWAFTVNSNDVDIKAIPAAQIDATIAERRLSDVLRLYDGEYHAGMLNHPKWYRQLLAEPGPVFTDADIVPFELAASH